MPTWPMGSGHDEDEDLRRSENEGFGQEAALHQTEEQAPDVRDADPRDTDVGDTDVQDTDLRDAELQDVDAQDRYTQGQDIPVASSPVETAEDAHAQETPVQDVPVTTRPSEEGQSLFQPGFADTFHERWREIQSGFVDDPHETVREADQLADEVVSTLTTALTDRKRGLDERWQAEKENTEELRLAMRAYRDLLDRLIKL